MENSAPKNRWRLASAGRADAQPWYELLRGTRSSLRWALRPRLGYAAALVTLASVVWFAPKLRAGPGTSFPRLYYRLETQSASQPAAVQQKTTPSSRDLFDGAQQALRRKDYASAASDLKELLKAAPDAPGVWFDLGYAYSHLSRLQDAVQAYQKAAALKPDLVEAHLNLGILLLQLKQTAPALAQLRKAESLRPADPKIHLFVGRALMFEGKGADAEGELQQAVKLDPDSAVAEYNLGQLYLSEKRFADANGAFSKTAALDPALPGLQLDRALALEGLNQTGQAAAVMEQYLAQNPADNQARFRLARLQIQQGENQKALENLLPILKSDPHFPELDARLGDVYALLKKFPESERYYRQALATMSVQPDLHRALGQTLLEEQKFPEAEAQFRAALKLDPHNGDAIRGLAASVYFEKRYADAIPMLQALLKTPNPPAGYYFFLATCFDHLHALPQALEAYQRFVQLTANKASDQAWQAEQRIKLIRHELRK